MHNADYAYITRIKNLLNENHADICSVNFQETSICKKVRIENLDKIKKLLKSNDIKYYIKYRGKNRKKVSFFTRVFNSTHTARVLKKITYYNIIKKDAEYASFYAKKD